MSIYILNHAFWHSVSILVNSVFTCLHLLLVDCCIAVYNISHLCIFVWDYCHYFFSCTLYQNQCNTCHSDTPPHTLQQLPSALVDVSDLPFMSRHWESISTSLVAPLTSPSLICTIFSPCTQLIVCFYAAQLKRIYLLT